MDVTLKTVFDERGQIAAMVNVGMREERKINRLGIEGQVSVALKYICAMTLGESAIEQDAPPFAFDEVHRTGDSTRRAKEG